MTDDRYLKLRPFPAPPADELCACQEIEALALCYVFYSRNPLRCLSCNNEVPPERLDLTPAMVDSLASWASFYGCFYLLWLESGEFETWARQQLTDPRSPANERGLAVCGRLSEIKPCYFWWFEETVDEDYQPLSACPRCGAPLAERPSPSPPGGKSVERESSFRRLVCEPCRIVVCN